MQMRNNYLLYLKIWSMKAFESPTRLQAEVQKVLLVLLVRVQVCQLLSDFVELLLPCLRG